MRIGSGVSLASPHTKSAIVMKELIESRVSGRIDVQIFPDGQLGGGAVMLNAIKSGTLDVLCTAVSIISPAVPEIDVFCLPFLYKDSEDVLRVANSPFGAKLTPKVNEAYSCEVLGYTTDGSTEMLSRKRAIRTPDDIAGQKIAVSTSKIQRDTMLAFGAIPTVVPLVNEYTSLQTGLVDGGAMTRPDIIDLKVYQVTKYLTQGNLYTMPNLMMVSQKFMEKLSPEDQAIVREAGQPSCDAQKDMALAAERDALGVLREKGMEIVQIENLPAFREKVEIVYKQAAERIGADLIAEARKLATS
jgi:TRAP-type transport system periplasmic protein